MSPNNFDALRLGLAVLVIYSHCYPLGRGAGTPDPMERVTRGQMSLGGVAVDLFFVLSGFLITASAERSSSWGSYLGKRVRRIYPAFVVNAILLLAIVVPLAHAVVSRPVAGNFLLQTLRLREIDSTGAFATNPYPNSMNGSLWSIQYEFWCYLGVAALAAAGVLRRRWLVRVLLFASVGISVFWTVKGIVLGGKFLGVLLGSPQFWARLLPLYLAGVAAYVERDRLRLTAWGALVSLVVLFEASYVPFGWTLTFPFAGTYLALYLGYAPWLRLHHFGRRGDLSYGTYLYAFPITQLVVQAAGRAVNPWKLFVAVTPLTLVAAAASWFGVERWFLARGPHAAEATPPTQTPAVLGTGIVAGFEARADS